jgi:hypothetical protein
MNRNVLHYYFRFSGGEHCYFIIQAQYASISKCTRVASENFYRSKITFNLLVSCILTLESLWTFGAKKGGNHASKHGLPQ